MSNPTDLEESILRLIENKDYFDNGTFYGGAFDVAI
jgi:hypothetical protein